MAGQVDWPVVEFSCPMSPLSVGFHSAGLPTEWIASPGPQCSLSLREALVA